MAFVAFNSFQRLTGCRQKQKYVPPVPPQPILWFPLNDNTTNTANNGSLGSSNNLTMNNSTMVSTTNPFGATSYVLQLVTSTTAVGASIGSFTVGASATICVWFQVGQAFSGSVAPIIFYWNFSGTTTTKGFCEHLFNKGFLCSNGSTSGVGYSSYGVSGGTGTYSGLSRTDDIVIATNTWYHMAFIVGTGAGAAGSGSVYLNNQYCGKYDGTSIFSGTSITSLYIGNPVSTSSTQTIKFYDLRVYNQALTSTQVSQLYSNQPVTV